MRGAVGAPLGLVLEGGYSLEALADSVAALMPVLIAESAAGGDGSVPVHRLAAGAPRAAAPWLAGPGRCYFGSTCSRVGAAGAVRLRGRRLARPAARSYWPANTTQ